MTGAFSTGLGFYMMHSTLQLNATQMAPQARGTAMAVFAGCLFLGQSVGVSLGGLALRLGDASWLLLGASIWLGVLGAAFAWQIKRWQSAPSQNLRNRCVISDNPPSRS